MVDYNNENDRIHVPRFEEAAGFYTTSKRSYNMSKIRSRNSKPELILRKALWSKNIRFRLHVTKRLERYPATSETAALTQLSSNLINIL